MSLDWHNNCSLSHAVASGLEIGIRVFFVALLLGSPLFADAPVSKQDLARKIEANLKRVSVFESIRELAQSMGLRVFLFGGSASSFARYVKWDLQSEMGDREIQRDRFKYHFDQIYKSTQDLDLVISKQDGSSESLEELKKFEEAIRNLLPGIQIDLHGAKTSFENSEGKTKAPVFENSDWANQNTDSMSTSAIELTERSVDQSWVLSLHPKADLLESLAEGKIHFLVSEKHFESERAKEGMNPPILSVIRFLINALRNDLEISEPDQRAVKKIIEDLDPSENPDSYVSNWIEINAKKLLLQAVDLEHASNLLNELGLREKLLAMKSLEPASKSDSLRSLLGRRVLKSKSGQAQRTKDDSKISKLPTRLVHQTNSMVAWESITANPRARPNFFISDGTNGTSALGGSGVYFASELKDAIGGKVEGSTEPLMNVHVETLEGLQEGIDYRYYAGSNAHIFTQSENLRIVYEDQWPSEPLALFENLLETDIFNDQARAGSLLRRMMSVKWSDVDSENISKFIYKLLSIDVDSNSYLLEKILRVLFLGRHPKLNQIGHSIFAELLKASPQLANQVFYRIQRSYGGPMQHNLLYRAPAGLMSLPYALATAPLQLLVYFGMQKFFGEFGLVGPKAMAYSFGVTYMAWALMTNFWFITDVHFMRAGLRTPSLALTKNLIVWGRRRIHGASNMDQLRRTIRINLVSEIEKRGEISRSKKRAPQFSFDLGGKLRVDLSQYEFKFIKNTSDKCSRLFARIAKRRGLSPHE